jgi:hypothetical protein
VNLTEEVSLEELDEALGHIAEKLKDRYGNRLTWQRKALLIESLDDLLDYRLMLMRGENGNNNSISGNSKGVSG